MTNTPATRITYSIQYRQNPDGSLSWRLRDQDDNPVGSEQEGRWTNEKAREIIRKHTRQLLDTQSYD